MKVILQQNVPKLGGAGDIVEAAPGYYRNFLQPRSLAVLATTGALKKRDEDTEILRKKADKAKQEALELSQKITDLGTIRIGAKAGEGGKLYGKVTNKEVAAAIKKATDVDVDKRLIKMSNDIGQLGTYKVSVKLSQDAHAELNIEVVPEGTEDKPAAQAKEEAPEAQASDADDNVEDSEDAE